MAKETTELYIKTGETGRFISLLKEMGFSATASQNGYQIFGKPLSEVTIKFPHSKYSPANNRFFSFIHLSSPEAESNGLLQKTREELTKKARLSGISITQYV